LKYSEVPFHYSWSSSTKFWIFRKRKLKSLGLLYQVSPLERERYALRLLLLNIRGPISFDALRRGPDGVEDPWGEIIEKQILQKRNS
jgi:hypothetical protein